MTLLSTGTESENVLIESSLIVFLRINEKCNWLLLQSDGSQFIVFFVLHSAWRNIEELSDGL